MGLEWKWHRHYTITQNNTTLTLHKHTPHHHVRGTPLFCWMPWLEPWGSFHFQLLHWKKWEWINKIPYHNKMREKVTSFSKPLFPTKSPTNAKRALLLYFHPRYTWLFQGNLNHTIHQASNPQSHHVKLWNVVRISSKVSIIIISIE